MYDYWYKVQNKEERTMTRGLTDKQERILNFIVDYVDDKGYPRRICI